MNAAIKFFVSLSQNINQVVPQALTGLQCLFVCCRHSTEVRTNIETEHDKLEEVARVKPSRNATAWLCPPMQIDGNLIVGSLMVLSDENFSCVFWFEN